MATDDSAQLVRSVLTKLGIDITTSQLPEIDGQGWAIPTEKSVLFLHIVDIDNQPYMQLTCPILYMPPGDLLPFYRKMLDLNSELAGLALAMDRDIVCTISQQALEGLSVIAIEGLILRSCKTATTLADVLVQEFNSARYWRPM